MMGNQPSPSEISMEGSAVSSFRQPPQTHLLPRTTPDTCGFRTATPDRIRIITSHSVRRKTHRFLQVRFRRWAPTEATQYLWKPEMRSPQPASLELEPRLSGRTRPF